MDMTAPWSDNPKMTDEYLNRLAIAGKQRSQQENALLRHMFEASPVIRFDNTSASYEAICVAYHSSQLQNYERHSALEIDKDYVGSTEKVKMYCNCVTALEMLVIRGVVTKSVMKTNNEAPEDGQSELPDDIAYRCGLNNPVTLGRSLFQLLSQKQAFRGSTVDEPGLADDPLYMFNIDLESAEYALTNKGYDVALTLQEHRVQEERFQFQETTTEKAIEISASSSKTAKRALWAATFIAIGSLGNLALTLYKTFCW